MLSREGMKERKWRDAITLGRLLGFPEPAPVGWTSVHRSSGERLVDLLDTARASAALLPSALLTADDPNILRETMRDLEQLRCGLRVHQSDFETCAGEVEHLMSLTYARLEEIASRSQGQSDRAVGEM